MFRIVEGTRVTVPRSRYDRGHSAETIEEQESYYLDSFVRNLSSLIMMRTS